MTATNELVLKPINELLDESFFIPSYQRGYRWTRRQVTELLDDIREFQLQSEEGPRASFYCLQPVVVKSRGNGWELVDGQQRLTTIHIILGCLKRQAEALEKAPYKLQYDTRPDSAAFLEYMDEELCLDNIDFFHMYEARLAIQQWFEEKDGGYKLKFLQTLLGDEETGRNVKVVWYQINEDIDVTAVFTRLNLGKIPLTNAELVKALFLQGSNFSNGERYLKQLRIAQEWDEIERTLQQDDFWYFISNNPAEANRIEFVLSLIADQLQLKRQAILRGDPYYIFLKFSHWLSDYNGSIDQEWNRIKGCFMTLREWFENRTLFHLIGFLVSRGTPVNDLLAIFYECPTKTAFMWKLKARVFASAFPWLPELGSFENKDELEAELSEHLDQLSYDSPKRQLISVLLLFNVATLLVNPRTNARFQFDRFKSESWDIEHIRSVASDMPRNKKGQRDWLEGVVDYIEKDPIESVPTEAKLRNELSELLAEAKATLAEENFDSTQFETLFGGIHALYALDSDEKIGHSLGNLTLLDSSTNRSYKNAIFPIKRNSIIALDKTATFVPVCTKNVFLKYYSDGVDSMLFWNSHDVECHKAAMVEVFGTFFMEQEVAA